MYNTIGAFKCDISIGFMVFPYDGEENKSAAFLIIGNFINLERDSA